MNARTPLRLRALWAALLAALVIALPVLPASAADSGEVTWTVRTASNSLGANRTSYGYTITPGGSVTDALVVANRGQDPVALKVYAADGFTGEGGQLSLLTSGERSQAVGAWIVPEQATVTVAPGESATIPFTVAVPQSASPGDYSGGIVTSLTVPDASSGVSVDRRLGIRVNLRVGGTLAPSLAVEDMSVSWNGGLNPFAGGDATVSYTVRNTGNARLSAQSITHLGGFFGLYGADADGAGPLPQLLPGESWTQTVTVAGVPPVFALFASTSVTPMLTDAAGSTAPLDAVTAGVAGAAVPWSLLVLLALLAAAIVLLVRRGRRRRAAARDEAEARLSEAVAKAREEERAKASV